MATSKLTFSQLLIATDPGLEDDGAGGVRVKVDSTRGLARATAGVQATSRLLNSSITTNSAANTLTETNFGSSYTFAANELVAGSVIRARYSGRYVSDGVAGVTFRTYYGATLLRTTGVLVGANVSNRGWIYDYSFVVGVGGAGGTGRNIIAMGYNGLAITYITDQADVAVALNASGLFKFTAQWDTATAALSISHTASHIEAAGA